MWGNGATCLFYLVQDVSVAQCHSLYLYLFRVSKWKKIRIETQSGCGLNQEDLFLFVILFD